jgi:hypothetical protein
MLKKLIVFKKKRVSPSAPRKNCFRIPKCLKLILGLREGEVDL